MNAARAKNTFQDTRRGGRTLLILIMMMRYLKLLYDACFFLEIVLGAVVQDTEEFNHKTVPRSATQ